MKSIIFKTGIYSLKKSKSITYLVLMTLFLFACSSCKKEKNSTPNNNNNQNSSPPTKTSFSAKIDGTSWTTDSTEVSAIFTSITKTMVMTAKKPDGSMFTIQINLWNLATGTFNTSVVAQENIVGLTYKDANKNSWTAPTKINNTNTISTGTLKIEYYDGKKIKCSFNFTGGSQLTPTTLGITEGEISIMSIKN